MRLKVCDVQGEVVQVYMWRKGRSAAGRNQRVKLARFNDRTANGYHPVTEKVNA